jgi:hypothetical protein
MPSAGFKTAIPATKRPQTYALDRHATGIAQKNIYIRVTDSANIPHDTRVQVTFVARPLLTLLAQKLCRCERGVFASRIRVHSRTLHLIEIVCC